MEKKMEKQSVKAHKGTGFTSYSNAHVTCSYLPDHLYRFKMVLETHMGSRGRCRVKLATIASEMGKDPKSASRAFRWFRDNSNLKAKKVGYIYEFYTSPDTSVQYGRTRVSHIEVHGCPHIKRLNEKEVNKKTQTQVSFKRNLNKKETDLIDEIVVWVSNPSFKTILTEKQNRQRAENALRNIGYKKLCKAYRSVAITGGDPHPKIFWEVVENYRKEIV
jgi:hypothetical protein